MYEVDVLRHFGVMPVFYMPPPLDNGGLSMLATQLISGLLDSMRIVDNLGKIRSHLANNSRLGMKYRGRQIDFDEAAAATIKLFVEVLFESALCDPGITEKRLSALSSCFYPTENLRYNDALSYYRQREWRIVHADLECQGQPIFTRATPGQVSQLISIDERFFEKELPFFQPDNGIGAKELAKVGERCYFFRALGDKDVLGSAKGLIVPDDVAVDSEEFAQWESRGVRVIQARDCGAGWV
jgi:hypothetical protein